MMSLLLDYGADPYKSDFQNNWRDNDRNEYSEFHVLCADDKVEHVRLLLDYGMGIYGRITIPYEEEYEVTPLDYAIKSWSRDVIKLLIERGCCIDEDQYNFLMANDLIDM